MKKALKITGIAAAALVGLVVLILLGFKVVDGIRHAAFYKAADGELKTPGFRDGLVQQGFDYVAEEKVFLAVGYMNDDSASRVYVLREDGSVSYTALKKANGSDYTGHTGGIAHFGDYIYITGGDGLDVFSYADILSGAAETSCLGALPTYNDPAYCYIANGHILVGSFYRPGNYETEDYQQMTTPCGNENKSIITVFALDAAAPFGVAPTLRAVISTPHQVQGMCLTDSGKLVLSTSYGMASSKLLVYDTARIPFAPVALFQGVTESGESFAFANIPLFYLEESCLVETVKAPPMSEELVYLDGKIYIMNESASAKYIFGRITSGKKVFAYPYS
ncbi:MAG: hypothetical protein E7590_02205 [Ruminococcaceae bacterium]|nr:hypothetical protein [Oscillospiraceae bacterium]